MKYGAAIILAAGLAVMSSVPALAKEDKAFLKEAIQGDISEVQFGRLALQKAGSPAVRDFGQTLVTDHGAAQQQAVGVAKQIGVTPPTEPMKKAQKEYDKISKLSGSSFDREFIDYMIKDHKDDIAKFTKASKEKDGGQVAHLAAASLPTLKKHLATAQGLQKETRRGSVSESTKGVEAPSEGSAKH